MPRTTTRAHDAALPEDVDIPTRVLVLGMAHHDGTILASELYPVAEACGQTPDQVRSCLRRLVGEGLFTRDGEGRDATFAATASGMRALGSTIDRARLAYHQDAEGRGWDGTWRLVGFAVPEARRAARDGLRDRVLALGGAAIQNGLYASPHPWHDDVLAEAERLGVRDHVTLATTADLEIGGERDRRALARMLWDIDAVAADYRGFCEVYGGTPDTLDGMRRDHRRLSEAEFLPGSLLMVIRFERCFRNDPLLPPELLPRPWPGRDARDLVMRSRRLGIRLREEHNKPRLFAGIDALLDRL